MCRIAFALAAAALAAAAAAADFEGRAEYKVTGSRDQRGTAEALIGPGGARFHFELTSPELTQAGMPVMKATTLVQSGDRGHVYTIDEARHSYAVIDTDPKEHDSGWKVTKLGPSTVAGYPCQRARIESEGSRNTEVCVSTTLGRVPIWATARGQGSEGVPAALIRAGLDGLPLRWATEVGEGNGGFVLEVVKVTRERVPASAFEVPAGYTNRGRGTPVASPNMRARMEEAMKKMSPEQRKRLEQMLHGNGAGPGN